MDEEETADDELKEMLSAQQLVYMYSESSAPNRQDSASAVRFGLPKAGDTFAERYKITRLLGTSGMSAVYGNPGSGA